MAYCKTRTKHGISKAHWTLCEMAAKNGNQTAKDAIATAEMAYDRGWTVTLIEIERAS